MSAEIAGTADGNADPQGRGKSVLPVQTETGIETIKTPKPKTPIRALRPLIPVIAATALAAPAVRAQTPEEFKQLKITRRALARYMLPLSDAWQRMTSPETNQNVTIN